MQNMIKKEEEQEKKILWAKKYQKPQVMIILVHENFVAKIFIFHYTRELKCIEIKLLTL